MHRPVRLAALTTLAVLAVPAAAMAHHVNAPATAATVRCDLVANAPVISGRVLFEQFAGQTGITGTVREDNVVRVTIPPFKAPAASFGVPFSFASTPGAHFITGAFTWPAQGSNNGTFSAHVVCPAPVVTPPPAPVVAPVAAPAPAPVAAPAPRVEIGTPLIVHAKRHAKRCAHGRRTRDSHGRRLRDSKGRRIALCRSAPGRKVGRAVTPKFTG